MGTLSKALGSLGGFVVGSKELISYIHNKARSFIYSTALPAPVLAASIASLRIAQDENWRRIQVLKNADFLRKGLQNLEFNTLESGTQIIPILIGETKKALNLSQYLLSKNIFAPAIRPPTVSVNSSRLRISLMAIHTKEQLQYLLDSIVWSEVSGAVKP
jgi:7-keto-8-aminopelargonate synthetase-like enzyme